IGMGFSCTGNVVSTLFFEDAFCADPLIAILGMNRDKDPTFLYFALIALGFVLRYAQTDQGASESADPGADRSAAQGRHDGTSGDEGAKARNRQCAGTGQQSNRAADSTARTGADGCTLGHLCFLFMSEITGACLVREQYGNVVIGEASASKLSDDSVGLCFCINET